MCRVFETIKVINKVPQNIIFHQKRVEWTFREYYKSEPFFNLTDLVKTIDFPDGLIRFKVIYDKDSLDYQCYPYSRKKIGYLELVSVQNLDYRFKYTDRSVLEKYIKNELTEPIFVINGFLTDTTFTNLAFFDGFKWWTPNTYLLRGTKREFLLKNGIILEAKIRVEDLTKFKKVSLINSMNELDEFSFSIDKIINL